MIRLDVERFTDAEWDLLEAAALDKSAQLALNDTVGSGRDYIHLLDALDKAEQLAPNHVKEPV